MYGWRNDAWREVIAADSRKKILDRRDQMLEQHGDATDILHTTEDGSTIRKLNGQGDHDYESDMQGNCVRDHAADNNVHSLRDKDNIPILSFGMDLTAKGDCLTCNGNGETYRHAAPADGYYEQCGRCNGRGRLDSNESDGVIRLHSVLRKENESPREGETFKLVDALKDKYHGEGYHSVQVDGSQEMTFDQIDDAKQKARTAEDRLPKGDVYLKVPESQYHVDDEGTTHEHGPGTLHPYGEGMSYGYKNDRPQISKTDPGPSKGHYVIKTPYTPRRFKHDTGFNAFMNYGSEMPEEPEHWVSDEASFPKNSYSVVHAPDRPTKAYITTVPSARDNSHFYRPEGMHPGMIEGNVSETEPGNVKSSPDGGPAIAVSHHDLWEVNWKDDDEARKFMKNNHPSNDLLHIPKEVSKDCETCKGIGHVPLPEPNEFGHVTERCDTCDGKGTTTEPNIIPWDRLKLIRPAKEDQFQGGLHPMPKMTANEDGSVGIKVEEPKTLYFQPHLMGESKRTGEGDHTWQSIHDLENSHLSQEDWHKASGYNDGLTSTKPADPTRGYEAHEAPTTIGVPNDPKYVEEIPQDERRDGNKSRQWRIKDGVKIPRSEYTLEHGLDHDVAPDVAYLHVPHGHRDNPNVFTDQGINIQPLLTQRQGYGGKAENDFKITTEPNTETPAHWNPHHPFSPSEADIFKLDMSKLPNWGVKSNRANHSYGEDTGSGEHRTRITTPGRKRETCETCEGTGGIRPQPSCTDCAGRGYNENEQSKVIPWEAVTGLHSKAEVQPTEEYKKRFATLRMQGSSWGEVRGRRVRAYD